MLKYTNKRKLIQCLSSYRSENYIHSTGVLIYRQYYEKCICADAENKKNFYIKCILK